VENPADDAAWSGLALLRGWERVEVVAAVYRELRRGSPTGLVPAPGRNPNDPTSLGNWIGLETLR
jgi:hypothetical protein